MKKKVLIISNFHEENNISRTNIAYNYFVSKGYSVNVLYSKYSHSQKKFRYLKNKDFLPLSTISYNSSLSLSRIVSYLVFSYRVLIFMKSNKYDIIYYNLPPNIITIPVFLCRGRGKVIVDVLDLWPESFPGSGKFFQKLPISIMGVLLKGIRSYAIRNSDYRIAESQLFYDKLNLEHNQKAKVIHLKKMENISRELDVASEVFSIVYLGNIGNIYDYESLFEICVGLKKCRPFHLHIIGLGVRGDWLKENLEIRKIEYTDHGPIFDETRKSEIISKCWFGYNGFKINTEVALSYKSIDYLSFGVPLINSAKDDTTRLVNLEAVGFNFERSSIEGLLGKLTLISYREIMEMKGLARSVFEKDFSYNSYADAMDEVLLEI